jgi:hypothetical protein
LGFRFRSFFRVEGLGLRAQGLGFKVDDSRLIRVYDLRFVVLLFRN